MAAKLAQKKSRKDELDNLLCELRDDESDSNVSVAGSQKFSQRNPMDEDYNHVMLPPLTNRSNNQISSLPAIQPQKKQITSIREIHFEGETPAIID